MAGEISKAIGERGEEVAKKIFTEILGYDKIVTGISIECFKGKEHKLGKAKDDRKSHGIDGLVGDVSQLSNRTLDIGYISVKKTEKVGYKKADVAKHIRDLAYGLECFKKSKKLAEFKRNYSNIKDAEIIGILIYFSDLNDLHESLNEYVKDYNIPSDLDFDNIVIIDNKRISFFIDTILKDKLTFGKDNISFVYHNSGLNPAIQNYYGSNMPLYYLFSDIIVTRIKADSEVILKFFYVEEYSDDILRGMIDLAIDYDKLDSIDKVVFTFKDYIKSESQANVQEILIQYQSHFNPEKVEVTGHFPTFKNL
ncbi:MAG: hypothetical protein RSD71_12955 [Flavobacterium sp.]|uniref:hypothetical protein n=1 Tax=Flavobacterium sp. TaxID=239 RepID=UPI002FC6CADA